MQKHLSNFKEQPIHVSQHDFIFSDQFRHRLARHMAFCFACYIFFCISFYIPLAVFPAWNTEMFATNSARLGFPTWLKWRVFNSTMKFLPNLAFAYSVIYFVLPRHYFGRKNPLITTIVFAGILILIFLVSYLAVQLV
ncbi:MAG: hypothetical protein ABR503_14405, partial [Chitinophagaceae bacterium]